MEKFIVFFPINKTHIVLGKFDDIKSANDCLTKYCELNPHLNPDLKPELDVRVYIMTENEYNVFIKNY